MFRLQEFMLFAKFCKYELFVFIISGDNARLCDGKLCTRVHIKRLEAVKVKNIYL